MKQYSINNYEKTILLVIKHTHTLLDASSDDFILLLQTNIDVINELSAEIRLFGTSVNLWIIYHTFFFKKKCPSMVNKIKKVNMIKITLFIYFQKNKPLFLG